MNDNYRDAVNPDELSSVASIEMLMSKKTFSHLELEKGIENSHWSQLSLKHRCLFDN